ncbi:MAG TPA: zf-HC2 domain-containing protein [Pyrinomonadaceae bacterium]|nr:zf-HC2 domain-containing protein [Pyrinomonadaceae bacterium]
MRQETNHEIDLLLRRLSRRQEVPASDADSHIDSDHLDADELSAYAENVVPAAARARYTAHLADCSKCREIVVQLSASVPVVAARETVTAAEPFGLRKFLASFFSPMVLRYAVPALGLIVVAAIGFVVFTPKTPEANVAQLEPSVQSPAAKGYTQESPTSGFYDAREKSSSPQTPRQSQAEKPIAAANEPPPPAALPSAADTAPPKTAVPSTKVEQQAVANEPPAQPKPTPTSAPTVDEMRVDVQGRRNEQGGGAQARDLAKSKVAANVEQKKAEDLEAASARAPSPSTGAARAQRGETDSSFRVAEEGEKDGIIRSVAGRRFRKQGAAWVDTAYNSGSAIINVARGSEQYRGLVADEPDLKRIAEQLDGVIVVVWKGRTYRIR